MRILVIDDDPEVAADLRLLLPLNIEVEAASDSREALAVLRRTPLPEAILLDLCLPADLAGTDEDEGLILLSRIRQSIRARIPVIILTATRSRRARESCIKRGADLYLEKPPVIDELVAALSHLSSGRA